MSTEATLNSRVARRVDYVLGFKPGTAWFPAEAASILRTMRPGLDSCGTPEQVRRWASELADPLKGFERCSLLVPLLEYLRQASRPDYDVIEFEVGGGHLLPLPGDIAEWNPSFARHAHALSRDAAEIAYKLASEAVLTSYPCAPKLDPGVFEAIESLRVAVEVPISEFTDTIPGTEGLKANSGVVRQMAIPDRVSFMKKAIGNLVADGKGTVLVLHGCTFMAAVCPLQPVRAEMWDIVNWGIEDVLVLPLTPDLAGWAISRFHHGEVAVGRRRAAWPHRVHLAEGVC